MDETTCGYVEVEVLNPYAQRAEELEAYAQRAEELPPALIAFVKDAQSALEEAQIKLTRAGINMNNNRAYIRALKKEITDGECDLINAQAEQVGYDVEYQEAFSRVQWLADAVGTLTAAKI